MKKLIYSIIILICIQSLYAQELNQSAKWLRLNNLEVYTNLKKFAWIDHMDDPIARIIFINQQSKAYIECMKISNEKKCDQNLLKSLLKKWYKELSPGFYIFDYKMILLEYKYIIKNRKKK